MNIDDVKAEAFVIPENNFYQAIFSMQHGLYLRYREIERRNGFYKPDDNPAPNIDDAQFQNWVKNMFWRVTEEIAEALECCVDYGALRAWAELWNQHTEMRHFYEEISDALHFLAEVSVLVGFDPHIIENFHTEMELNHPSSQTSSGLFNLILSLGRAANALKNKPWKSTHMACDRGRFDKELRLAWFYFVNTMASLGWSRRDVFLLYAKKNEVNKFRQASNY